MARELLSAKLGELDREFEKLRSRIHLGEEASREEIEQEIAQLRRDCASNELNLRSKLSLSRAETVSRLSKTYGRVEQIIKDAKEEISFPASAEEWTKSLSAEEKALLAEYALDFAVQAANRALLISLEAINDALELQEKEEE